MALGDDLVAHRRVERPEHVVEQQGPRVVVAESLDEQLGEPGEHVVADIRAGRAHDSDPFGMQTAGDEAENLRRGMVEPLRVVDDAGERLLLGDLGKAGSAWQARPGTGLVRVER